MAHTEIGLCSDIAKGGMKKFNIDGKSILVFHLEDGVYATQAKCPHLNMPLEKGRIKGNCILQCKFHRAEFNIKTGEVEKWANFPPIIVQVLNVIKSEKKLKTYKCHVEENKISIET